MQIYDVVVFFNAAYLSRSMSEAILKLFKASQMKTNTAESYQKADAALQMVRQFPQRAQLNETFMSEAMQLLVVGDFGNFRTLI